jgi:hypothetical protein
MNEGCPVCLLHELCLVVSLVPAPESWKRSAQELLRGPWPCTASKRRDRRLRDHRSEEVIVPDYA